MDYATCLAAAGRICNGNPACERHYAASCGAATRARRPLRGLDDNKEPSWLFVAALIGGGIFFGVLLDPTRAKKAAR